MEMVWAVIDAQLNGTFIESCSSSEGAINLIKVSNKCLIMNSSTLSCTIICKFNSFSQQYTDY